METVKSQGSGANMASSRSRTRAFGITVLTVLLLAVAGAAVLIAQRMEKDFESALQQKDVLLGMSRADSASAWLTGMSSQADRLIGADIFKVFASEVDQLGADIGVLLVPTARDKEDEGSQMAAQLPLMRNLLSEFVSYSDFFAGRVLNRRGETYMSTTPVTQPLGPEQQTLVKRVLETGHAVFCPVRTSPQGLMLDMLFPINAPQYEGKEPRPVSALMLTKAISSKLGDILASGPLSDKGTESYLIQKGYVSFQDVTPKGDALRDVRDFAPGADGHVPFAVRASLMGRGQVYSYGHKVARIDWWIVQERDYGSTRAPLEANLRIAYGLAALMGLVILLMGGAAWWWLMGRDQREVADRFREMNTVIGEQKRLLDGINSTITDPIALTDAKGVFRYVNLAFAKVVGRDVESTVGLDVTAIFGFDTAKRLAASDQRVLMGGEHVMIVETLWLQSRRYIFQISKSPLRSDEEASHITGIVSVYRDITKTVEAEERGRRAVQQTIDALISAIEASDPFLGGHSRIMAKLAGMIAKALQLPERDAQTIEVAANLSQIGKAFVPRELLLKPGQLTDEEKKIVESHVEHTRNVLAQIEFDLPVVDAIYQMNERLDGSGYPQKLTVDQISMDAKVLAVANAFAAMARPRSYRPGMPVEKVLSILEQDTNAYDATVVRSLRAVLQTPEGNKLIQLAAASKA
ncbi:MAG: PAS domain-containing protein [Deltaproteobacteria bacterium]|jgi:PAS domain S-box-containing protein|nr:PAS domain-containing protein [Deltaproteobacteria bacterium]